MASREELRDELRNYPIINTEVMKLNGEINNCLEMIQELREGIRGANINGMPMGNNIADPVGNVVEQIMDRYNTDIKRFSNKINELLDMKKTIEAWYSTLDFSKQQLVSKIFFVEYSPEKSWHDLHVDKSTYYRYRNELIDSYSKYKSKDESRQDVTS